MPTYDYVCQHCGYAAESFEGVYAKPIQCPKCHKPMRRQVGAGLPPIFIGAGFYCNDYGKSGKEQVNE